LLDKVLAAPAVRRIALENNVWSLICSHTNGSR
jgi:hypothetical protein